jgi:hypothetical protein
MLEVGGHSRHFYGDFVTLGSVGVGVDQINLVDPDVYGLRVIHIADNP